MRNRIYIVLKSLPTNMLINYKGRISKFTVERPGRHHLNQVGRANTINNEANWSHVPPDGPREGRAGFLWSKQNVSLSVRKSADRSRLGDAAKQMGSSLQSVKVRGRLGKCSRPRERRASQLKAAGGSGRASAIKILLE